MNWLPLSFRIGILSCRRPETHACRNYRQHRVGVLFNASQRGKDSVITNRENGLMIEMRFAPVARGLLTYVPAIDGLLPPRSEGQTTSARYCYDLWLRHLTLL